MIINIDIDRRKMSLPVDRGFHGLSLEALNVSLRNIRGDVGNLPETSFAVELYFGCAEISVTSTFLVGTDSRKSDRKFEGWSHCMSVHHWMNRAMKNKYKDTMLRNEVNRSWTPAKYLAPFRLSFKTQYVLATFKQLCFLQKSLPRYRQIFKYVTLLGDECFTRKQIHSWRRYDDVIISYKDTYSLNNRRTISSFTKFLSSRKLNSPFLEN